MYSIYSGEMPDMEDGLDEVAANQRAIALLQRIYDEDPDLWNTIENLPDGIRSALEAKSAGGSDDMVAIEGSQSVFEIHGGQMPLMSPANTGAVPSPFDEPGPGETLVLLSAGEIKGCYAVSLDSDGEPQTRAISPAQFIIGGRVLPRHARQSAARRD